MPIVYKEVRLDHGYRIDLLVEDKLVVELKTVECFTDVHFAQVLTYLKFGSYPLGLLLNFDVSLLKDGIRRMINTPPCAFLQNLNSLSVASVPSLCNSAKRHLAIRRSYIAGGTATSTKTPKSASHHAGAQRSSSTGAW